MGDGANPFLQRSVAAATRFLASGGALGYPPRRSQALPESIKALSGGSLLSFPASVKKVSVEPIAPVVAKI